MPPRVDIKNKKFGRLTAIECVGRNKHGCALWRCKCDCGNEVVAIGANLRNGNTKSCGCINIETATRRIVDFNTTHGKTNTRLFRIWSLMKARCYNKHAINYSDYGGRGIAICEKWKKSFEDFYEWSIANGYEDTLTIDRIDVNGNYEPTNCRWATIKEQQNNRRSNRKIEYNGETHTVSEWAEMLGMSDDTLLKRLDSRAYTLERALTEPLNQRGKYDRAVTKRYLQMDSGR